MNGQEPSNNRSPQAQPAPAVEEVHMRFNPITRATYKIQAESFFRVLLKKKLDINEMANVIAQMVKMLHGLSERVNAAKAGANEGAQHVQK